MSKVHIVFYIVGMNIERSFRICSVMGSPRISIGVPPKVFQEVFPYFFPMVLLELPSRVSLGIYLIFTSLISPISTLEIPPRFFPNKEVPPLFFTLLCGIFAGVCPGISNGVPHVISFGYYPVICLEGFLRIPLRVYFAIYSSGISSGILMSFSEFLPGFLPEFS